MIRLNAAEIRNKKIIDAVLEKEKAVCPGAVALIGIYGSFETGDVHPLSDLDLLILINDSRGWQLGSAFILEDPPVGYDIYCTDWESLRRDAEFGDPNIAKLMDSRIVYCSDDRYMDELEALRAGVRRKLDRPFCEADHRKAEEALKEAQRLYALAMIAETPSEALKPACGVLYYTENAVAMLNKTYFRRGVRRRFEELNAMKNRPRRLCELIEDVLSAGSVAALKQRLTALVRETTACFERARQTVLPPKAKPSPETLNGTYEEMYSNWHGKMALAAQTGDRHLAFMSLGSLDEMLSDISGSVDIANYDALSAYDPGDLEKTAAGFDAVLRSYLREYEKAGLKPKVYPDADAFTAAYPDPAAE